MCLVIMSKANPTCRICNVKLTDANWYPSLRKGRNPICIKCSREKQHRSWYENIEHSRSRKRAWRKANPEKQKTQYTRDHRKQGHRPFDENRNCSMFLGVHVAERVLSRVFKNVERMPMNNIGYDFICNHGKKIDVKSSCLWNTNRWGFEIKHNTTADYFLCIAFDNRDDLTPMHVWLIPNNVVSHHKCATISPTTIHKWDAYRLDISRISMCCEILKSE